MIACHCYALFGSAVKHTPTHLMFLSPSLSAQILTAQFRQMEQELADAVKLREEQAQQWAEETSQAAEALRLNQEALERERAEVVRQERELAALREAERVSVEAVEKERMEVARLEREVAALTEAELTAVHASESSTERAKSEIEKLQHELASAQKKDETLTDIIRRLQSLDLEDTQPSVENPPDLSLVVDTVSSIETKLKKLKVESSENEERCSVLTQTMEALQGEIH